MKTIAIVPAAGVGKRMGMDIRKQMLSLRGIPILHYTLKVLSDCGLIDGILLMTHRSDTQSLVNDLDVQRHFPKIIQVLAGGEERQDTVYIALEFLSEMRPTPGLIVIHDGVRPFLTLQLLRETIEEASRNHAAIAAVPITDTVKKAEDSGGPWIQKTLPRGSLWAAQTPQCFSFELIRKAYQAAKSEGFIGTDDASLVEKLGYNVSLVRGSYENIKITNPIDLIIGESILAARGGTNQ